MNISQALEKLTDAVRLRHLAASTEEAYRGWLQSYMQWLANHGFQGTSEQKGEAFLTMQARRGVAASTRVSGGLSGGPPFRGGARSARDRRRCAWR